MDIINKESYVYYGRDIYKTTQQRVPYRILFRKFLSFAIIYTENFVLLAFLFALYFVVQKRFSYSCYEISNTMNEELTHSIILKVTFYQIKCLKVDKQWSIVIDFART